MNSWKLHRALYGLKQAARQWNRCFDNAIKQLGFTPTLADPCVYTQGKGQNQVIVANYVDDCLILCKSEKQAKAIALQLEKSFKLRCLGEVSNYLGVQIQRVENGFTLCQSNKIQQLLEKWGMSDSKAVATPLEIDGQSKSGEDAQQPCNVEQYQSLLGSLLHLALWSRPDLSYATQYLSRKASAPTQADWIKMKRVLRYLKGSVGLKLYINPVQPLILSCYADSSWADDIQDRKSVSGHLITLGEVPVYWRSRKQNHVSTSSCESEYASLSDLISELIWHKQMMKDLDIPQSGPTVVNEDNQACIQLSQSEKTQGRSKHIHIRYHNVRDAVQSGEITLQYTPSCQNFADILTKSLGRVKFVRGVEMLNLK